MYHMSSYQIKLHKDVNESPLPVISMLKYMLINKIIKTWHLIDWQH